MDKVPDPSAKQSAEAAPILRLDDFIDADTIEIDRTRYAMTRLATFGLRRQARCRFIWNRMGALEEVAEPTEADEREYRALGREAVGYALPTAPVAILDKLDDEQLGDIVVAFFGRGALRSRRLAIARSMTGGDSSPGFNGSTAATPNGGST